jgi:hypothetical protein
MPFVVRPYRRFPVQCAVTYNAGPFQGQGTIWNFSCTGWRLSGDLPMRPGERLSLTVTLPNEQRIEVLQALVRWWRGQEFAVETVSIEHHTRTRLQHYVNRLVLPPAAFRCLSIARAQRELLLLDQQHPTASLRDHFQRLVSRRFKSFLCDELHISSASSKCV